MDWHGLSRDWRMWVLVVSLIISVSLIINPLDPVRQTDDGRYELKTNIKQGLDLQGGARVLIRPNTTGQNTSDRVVSQIISTLRTRVSAFGLQEMDIRPVEINGEQHVQIELAGANTSDLTELINRTGRFEARIPFVVGDGETITLGDQTYTADVGNGSVTVDGATYTPGDNFTLNSGGHDVQFTYVNTTETRARLSALAFSGEDIITVGISPQTSGVQQVRDGWRFQFQVSVTEDSARRVREIVQHFPKGGPGQNLRGAQLQLFLDGSLVSGLGISNQFKDALIQQPVITGGGDSREDAETEMEQLKSVLKSGALPVPITIVSTTTVSATLGAQFLQTAIIAILVAILAVALVIFVRYKDPRIVVPLTLTGFSELVMILGFAGFTGWTIDLPSIAGIIAAIGTGVDDQIIITDERGKQRLKSLKERFKRAFFIIFTSAASTIAAMLPLTQIGAGAIQGFAVTTIIGVLIGISITRPAYARVLQYMDE